MKRLFFAFFLSFLLSACSIEDIVQQLPEGAYGSTLQLTAPNGELLSLEIAADSETRTQGLMFRDSMPENAGMIFVFEDERTRSFWMKNTLIPLDILFLDSSGMIVDIDSMVPCPPETVRCPSTVSDEKAQFAIELNKGAAERLGFEEGLLLPLPDLSVSL